MRRSEIQTRIALLPKGDLTVAQVLGVLNGQTPLAEPSPRGLSMKPATNAQGRQHRHSKLQPTAVRLQTGDWFRVIPQTVAQITWLQGLAQGYEKVAIPAGSGDGLLINKSCVSGWPA